MCYDKNLLEKITFFCLTTHEVYNNHALNEDDDTFSRSFSNPDKVTKAPQLLASQSKLNHNEPDKH